MRQIRRPFYSPTLEPLEVRTALDASGMQTEDIEIEFEESDLVTIRDNGTLRFASLNVGAILGGPDGEQVLDDGEIIEVQGVDLSIGQVKALLHHFAESIGTNDFIETLDIRFSPWGWGSGSTTNRFEDFMVEKVTSLMECPPIRFLNDVEFRLPGEGGIFFTGGFLDLPVDGDGTLLRGGDIAEVVDRYEIVDDGDEKTLNIYAQLGVMTFTMNDDQTLTDEFDRIWTPESPYSLTDPNAVDTVLGDIDGDGTVGFADFLILSANFGQETDAGDLNDDGIVNFADFLILSQNFGTGSE